MNEETKNIETCLPESILAEVASVPTDEQFRSLVNEALDPLKQQALPPAGCEAYKETVMYHRPYTFTSPIRQMKVAAELFLDGASKALKEGYIVDLGPLGKLVPAVSGPWKTNPDDLELSAMEGKVNYRPSADIKTVIEGAEKGWTTKPATADNTDEEDETNTPQNPGGGSEELG